MHMCLREKRGYGIEGDTTEIAKELTFLHTYMQKIFTLY